MLIDRKNFAALHFRWMLAAIVILTVAGAWYGFTATSSERLPGGGSWPGLVLGVAAGLIILFEFALWPRKTPFFRTARWLGKTQVWLQAHIWLGLLVLPLALMHSGFSFGGIYTSALLWLLIVVVVSGVCGLLLQNVLPRLLIDRLPDESVATQIDVLASQLADDARRIVLAYCEEAGSAAPREDLHNPPAKQRVGVERRVGTVIERSVDPELSSPLRTSAPVLVAALNEEVEPYLIHGTGPRDLLSSRDRRHWYFEDLRQKCPAAVRPAIAELETLCRRRSELALQERLHFWLAAWLLVHLPLSVLLVILLVGHVYFALRFG